MTTKPRKLHRLKAEFLPLLLMVSGVFAFRSSIAEPYQVPTGSMEPTILPGDKIFVFKSSYDLKLPFTDLTLMHIKDPSRGDVIVFKNPTNPSVNFVKRLIGLPHDEITVTEGFIHVNGKPLLVSPQQQTQWSKQLFEEAIGNTHYFVQRLPHPGSSGTLRIKVPDDSYFFMGDNRDNSSDSRSWGFVPRSYLKGKVLRVWLSLDSSQGWIPSIRWDRFGKAI